MRKFIVPLVAAVLLGLGVTASTTTGATAEPVPACHSVTLAGNSGNGPIYKHLQVCNALKAGVNYLTVDGSPLQNGAVIFGSHVSTPPVSTPLASSASLTGGVSHIPGCWNHNGIHASGLIMYECISQPSGLGGALYWSANEANFNWDKHPGSGLDWVVGSTSVLSTDSSPPNGKQAFWVGIAHQGTFCTVINPGYDQHPTQCEINGAIHTMTAKQQASYDQFAASMVATGVPDCAWSQTIEADAAQCDIDS